MVIRCGGFAAGGWAIDMGVLWAVVTGAELRLERGAPIAGGGLERAEIVELALD